MITTTTVVPRTIPLPFVGLIGGLLCGLTWGASLTVAAKGYLALAPLVGSIVPLVLGLNMAKMESTASRKSKFLTAVLWMVSVVFGFYIHFDIVVPLVVPFLRSFY